jgi:hypothetical protein
MSTSADLLGLLSSGISFILQAAIKPNMGTQDYNVYEENIMSTRIDWLETRKHFITELTLPLFWRNGTCVNSQSFLMEKQRSKTLFSPKWKATK